MKTYHYLSEGSTEVTLSAKMIKGISKIKFIPAHAVKGLTKRIPDQTVVDGLCPTLIVGKDAKRAYEELTTALKAVKP